MTTDLLDRAIVARIPVIVKARAPEASGRRIVEVEASTEEVDADGDIVLQKALLDSAASFIANGHLDIDHKSEFGERLGIADPASYIVGRPLNVTSRPGNRTFVEGEISRSLDGSFDPVRNRFDELWDSLRREPPVQWFSSIYGFPTDVDDCTAAACTGTRASRFVIKAIDWRSLAFTRSPKNTALSSPTRIVTAKAFMAELLAKAVPPGPPVTPLLAVPQTMDDVSAAAKCDGCEVHKAPSLPGYRTHFAKCCGFHPGMADVFANALMYKRACSAALGGMAG
jgi:hypothetical protein